MLRSLERFLTGFLKNFLSGLFSGSVVRRHRNEQAAAHRGLTFVVIQTADPARDASAPTAPTNFHQNRHAPT